MSASGFDPEVVGPNAPSSPSGSSLSRSGWFIQRSPNQGGPQGFLNGDSCPRANWCVAVGFYYDDSGADATLAEHWNGTTWAVQSTPAIAGATESDLTAVSCTSPSFCVAVGWYALHPLRTVTLAEVWNGVSWAVRSTPNPPKTKDSILLGVSCSSVDACQAVGNYNNYSCFNCSGTWITLAEGWSGTAWTIEPTLNPSGDYVSFTGVSCTSTADCTAVGYDQTTYTSYINVVEDWNGTAWTEADAPDPPGDYSRLFAVSCTSASACTAVGIYENSSYNGLTLVESWNGSAWTIVSTPNVKNTMHDTLLGVSCASASACVAVGGYQVGSLGYLPLAMSWNGKGWSLEHTHLLVGTILYAYLLGVSCTSGSSCQAAGYNQNESGAVLTLSEAWNGSEWTLTKDPVVGNIPSYLYGASCPSSRECIAVGIYQGRGGTEAPFSEEWDGTSWTIQKVPNPATGSHPTWLYGVSCVSKSFCVATGRYQNKSSIYATLAEIWNGKSWAIQSTPNPRGSSGSNLQAVTCTSTTFCDAVGYYSTPSVEAHTLAEMWDGKSWAVVTTYEPTHSAYGYLNGVSCATPATCEAVGDYGSNPNRPRPLGEGWNGKSWAGQISQVPSGSNSTALYTVSCSAPDECTAVGLYQTASDQVLTLAEAWSGSNWTVQPTPNVEYSSHNQLNGVSCTSPKDCVAVGYAVDSSEIVETLAEEWNGSQWTIQVTPNPQHHLEVNEGSGLFGVSCRGSSSCTAVGYSVDSDLLSATLVERALNPTS